MRTHERSDADPANAARHRFEHLGARVALDQLKIDALLVERAAVEPGKDLAVDGDDTAFRCSEIRQRGPITSPPEAFRRPCGIARAMWRAEDAWRAELRATTVADLLVELLATVPASTLAAGAEWIQAVEVRRSNRTRSRGGQEEA